MVINGFFLCFFSLLCTMFYYVAIWSLWKVVTHHTGKHFDGCSRTNESCAGQPPHPTSASLKYPIFAMKRGVLVGGGWISHRLSQRTCRHLQLAHSLPFWA